MNEVKERLKGFFNTGDKPTEAQFAELIDSGLYLDQNGNLGIGTDEPEAKSVSEKYTLCQPSEH